MNHGFRGRCPDPAGRGGGNPYLALRRVELWHPKCKGKPVFSVQHHPEASPGPQDSFYLFERFAKAMEDRKATV